MLKLYPYNFTDNKVYQDRIFKNVGVLEVDGDQNKYVLDKVLVNDNDKVNSVLNEYANTNKDVYVGVFDYNITNISSRNAVENVSPKIDVFSITIGKSEIIVTSATANTGDDLGLVMANGETIYEAIVKAIIANYYHGNKETHLTMSAGLMPSDIADINNNNLSAYFALQYLIRHNTYDFTVGKNFILNPKEVVINDMQAIPSSKHVVAYYVKQ